MGDVHGGTVLPFDLAEAQAALALWEVHRALTPEIAELLGHAALLPAGRRRPRPAALWPAGAGRPTR